jgi:hypothetical protein
VAARQLLAAALLDGRDESPPLPLRLDQLREQRVGLAGPSAERIPQLNWRLPPRGLSPWLTRRAHRLGRGRTCPALRTHTFGPKSRGGQRSTADRWSYRAPTPVRFDDAAGEHRCG